MAGKEHLAPSYCKNCQYYNRQLVAPFLTYCCNKDLRKHLAPLRMSLDIHVKLVRKCKLLGYRREKYKKVYFI